MKIIWSPTSRRNIDEIVNYISADNIDAAWALVEKMETGVQDLMKHPRSGRMVPVLNDDTIRELIIRGDYLVVYKIKEDRIEILTVRHA